MFNGIRFTNPRDIEGILTTALDILQNIGMAVESEKLTALLLTKGGGSLRLNKGRVTVDPVLARAVFLSGKGRVLPGHGPKVSVCAEIYEGWYLNPQDDKYTPWNEEKFLSYINLAKRLPNVGRAGLLGCPLPGMSLLQKPLYEKLYSFAYGLECGGSIWDSAVCQPVLDIWKSYGREKNCDLSEVFGATVYLLTPMRFGHVEAEHFLWYYERGLRVGIGTLASLGLSVPVTPAGALAEQLAEQLFVGVLNRLLFGDSSFSLSSMLSVADPRTSAFQYGRPEQVLMNGAMAAIAEHFGMAVHLHGGLSDGKTPSYEAGVQKFATAMSGFMLGQTAHIAAGLLSVDEVCSPVQLVLDDEAGGYLRRLQKGFGVDAESLAYTVTEQAALFGQMPVEQEHTVLHLRENLWIPGVFSKEMYSSFESHGETDVLRAREKALTLMAGPKPEREISDRCYGEILAIIQKFG